MYPLDRTGFEHAQSARPEWRRSRAEAARDHFEKLDMPSSREEVWRYVDLDFSLGDYQLAAEAGPGVDRPDVIRASLGDVAAAATVRNGVAEVEASDDLPAGARFATIRSLPQADEQLVLDAIAPDLDIFSAAHHAFGSDGIVVAVDRPVEAPFFVDVESSIAGTVSFPRVSVTVAENAAASVVVNCRSPHDMDLVAVPQIEASLAPGARLDLSIMQNWGYATRAIGQTRVRVDRDATIRLAEVGLGADLSRLHLTTDLEGRGSSAEVLGVYFGERDQTLDYRYFMNHIGPNTTSEMFLKGAVEDEALSVFTGMIRIEKEAQRTNAHQTNRNLILSDGASAQSVPNLEILANDVRCGHGSTVGPLDDEQRYYLMSRGLDRPRADRLQVRGFFEEVIARLPQSGLADPVRDWLNTKYVTAQAEGRVG